MDVVMNGLLIAGTLFAGVYCYVLANRVRALKSLDSGLGGSIVTLTRQIELARATLEEARTGSRETRQDLGQLVARAEASAAQLRLLIAAVEPGSVAAPPAAPAAPASAAPVASKPAPAAAPEPAPSGPPAPPAPAAAPDGLVARRREVLGPRLVPPPEPEAAAGPSGSDVAWPTLPKPQRTMTLDSLLRRRVAPDSAAPQNEEELIAALSALAAGGER